MEEPSIEEGERELLYRAKWPSGPAQDITSYMPLDPWAPAWSEWEEWEAVAGPGFTLSALSLSLSLSHPTKRSPFSLWEKREKGVREDPGARCGDLTVRGGGDPRPIVRRRRRGSVGGGEGRVKIAT